MKTTPEQEAKYKTFIQDTEGRCWRCGRTGRDRPRWWGASFGIERAHIDCCNHPRKKDRRVVWSACSLCHKIQHGHYFGHYDMTGEGRFPRCTRMPLELEQLLRLKFERDPDFFDPEFLASCSIKRELVLNICREIQDWC